MKYIKKFESSSTLDLESAFEKITLDYDVYLYVSRGQDMKLTVQECLNNIENENEIYVLLDNNKAGNVIAFMEYLRFVDIRIKVYGNGDVYLYK